MDLTGRIWPAAHGRDLLEATLGLAHLQVPLGRWLGLLSRPALANAN